jgi:adenylosuccinate synthase
MRTYNELPETFKQYMDYVQKQINTKVSVISIGPDREQTIFM